MVALCGAKLAKKYLGKHKQDPDQMQDFAKDFYKSKTWQKCRQGYIASVGGLCERCLKNGLINPAVIVHHKVHITPDNITDPSVTLSYNNLEALCRDCHAIAHAKHVKRYVVDELGRVTAK